MALYKKGQSGNPAGRPRGAKGREVEKFKEYLSVEIYQRRGRIFRDLDKLDPLQRLNFICRLLPYFIPKAEPIDPEESGRALSLADFLTADELELLKAHREEKRQQEREAAERYQYPAPDAYKIKKSEIDAGAFLDYIESSGQRLDRPTLAVWLRREPTDNEIWDIQGEMIRRDKEQQEREQGDTDSTTDTDQTEDNQQDTAGGTPEGNEGGNVATA